MGGCAAANCSNHSRNGFRMFRFPTDEERRKKWAVNCRRNNWKPSLQSQICSIHFEESQYEPHREGKKKLKRDAIPTIFDVPNPPKLLTDKRKKGTGLPKPNSILNKKKNVKENVPQADVLQSIVALENENAFLLRKIESLEYENKHLKEEKKEMESKLASFLSNEQISALTGKNAVSCWSEDAIIKGLKIRFAVGKHGYNYLRSIGYPSPGYSTLNRRIQGLELDFGVMDMLFRLLQAKVDSMDSKDRDCCLLVDEMKISSDQDFDTVSKSFIGNTTLGKPGPAKHYTVVMLRGLCDKWKQVVAHELTGPSTSGPDMKYLISKTIEAATEIGLKVRASTSDMGSCNKALWSSLGVSVSRNERNTSYRIGENVIHCFADVPHLIKNMRSAFLAGIIILPNDVCLEHDLPTAVVSSEHLKKLWYLEMNAGTSLRSLHHLNQTHLFPTHFSKMNVAVAVQLFSTKTAAALEKAVHLKQISADALTSAWWIRTLAEWFELMTARHPKCGFATKNKTQKIQFLNYFVSIMQNIKLGNAWKPLQTGMIMSSLSVVNLATELLQEGYEFFLPGRLTQDALENVFSQVRRKSSMKPSALGVKRAMKLICLSQFISSVENSSYASDSDYHLLRTLSVKSINVASQPSTDDDLHISMYQLDDLSEDEPSYSVSLNTVDSQLNQPSSSQYLPPSNAMNIAAEENDIYYIAGATLRAISGKKSICESCHEALKNAEDNYEVLVPSYRTLLTEYSDMGGLIKPKSGIYRICREAERFFQNNRYNLLTLQHPITDETIQDIKNCCSSVHLPSCCNIKEAVINYYLIVRCKGLKQYLINKRSHETSFSSAAINKKQKKV